MVELFIIIGVSVVLLAMIGVIFTEDIIDIYRSIFRSRINSRRLRREERFKRGMPFCLKTDDNKKGNK